MKELNEEQIVMVSGGQGTSSFTTVKKPIFDCYYKGDKYSEGAVVKFGDGSLGKCSGDEWIQVNPKGGN